MLHQFVGELNLVGLANVPLNKNPPTFCVLEQTAKLNSAKNGLKMAFWPNPPNVFPAQLLKYHVHISHHAN